MDKSQDWYLIEYGVNATHTALVFTRKLLSCDSENDLELFDNEFEVSNIVFSYAFSNPPSIEFIGEPATEKVIHLNFFNPVEEFKPREDDIQEINYWLNVNTYKIKLLIFNLVFLVYFAKKS